MPRLGLAMVKDEMEMVAEETMGMPKGSVVIIKAASTLTRKL